MPTVNCKSTLPTVPTANYKNQLYPGHCAICTLKESTVPPIVSTVPNVYFKNQLFPLCLLYT